MTSLTFGLFTQVSDSGPSCLFSDLAALIAKSKNKKGFSTAEKAWITRLPGPHEVDMDN